MATLLGVGVTELLIAIAKVKDYLYDILTILEALPTHDQAAYPVLNAFSRKLDECNAFLERYSELKPAGFTISGDTPLKRVRRVWKITCYAFDNASQLKADLSQEMLKLITSRTVPGTGIAISSHSATLSLSQTSNDADPSVDDYRHIIQQLQKARESVQTEHNLAIESRRPPDFSRSYSEIDNVWKRLCQRAGFTEDSMPPLFREQLLQSSSQPWTDVVAGFSNISPYSHPYLGISSCLARELVVERACSVSMFLRLKEEHFLRYRLYRTPMLEWIGVDGSTILKHILPCEPFPHTMHHYVGNTLQIRFLEGHKLVLRKGGFVVHDLTVAVEYQFANDGEHRRFQEDLRGRKLVSGFEFNQVCSKRAPRFGESETRQDLKIWRRKDGNRLHTLSFFSTAVRRHLEYPVCWFEPVTLKTVLGSERPSNTITIMFVRGDGESQMVRISRKRSWSLRRVWSWKSPSAGKYNLPDSKVNKELIVIGSSPTTTAISSPRNSSRTSISSLHSFQSRDTNSDDDRYPPGDVPITIEYFTIKFSTNGDHLNFVREFEWAQKADGVQFSQPTVPWLERSEMTKANFDSAAPEMAFPLGSLVEEPVSTVPSEHLYSNPAGPSPPSNF